MVDSVVCEIAGLQRHGNPVHGRALFCAKSSWCRDARSSRRHEGTTVKRNHFCLPDVLKLGSDRAKATLAERALGTLRLSPNTVRSQGPRFSISSTRHGYNSFRFIGKMPDMRENSATFAQQPIVELTLERRARPPVEAPARMLIPPPRPSNG